MRRPNPIRTKLTRQQPMGGCRAVFAVAVLCLLAACAAAPQRSQASPGAVANVAATEIVGVASWYGKRYHGRQTASGEPFDMNALTAAHPSLPFGTRVRVTNLENDRSVVLRINDRGPFVKRRIIDVSRHAAEVLGFIRQGTTRVRVEII